MQWRCRDGLTITNGMMKPRGRREVGMSDIERRFSGMVESAAQPQIDDWVSRNWKIARDYLDGIGESPSDAVLDVIGLLLDDAEEQDAEIERLRSQLAGVEVHVCGGCGKRRFVIQNNILCCGDGACDG
jgi:hypothetical protein